MSQALSLSKMAEKALAEDEANALLWRWVAELEETNARLEDTNVELRLELSNSRDVAVSLRRELDEETEHCEHLWRCNTRLHNERNELDP
jgi:hypothetical protein